MTDEIRTPRLLLRAWRDADDVPFAALNADPRVAEHLPSVLTREASDEVAARIRRHFDTHGFGLWAVEREGAFIGFIGLQHVPFDAHFTPAVEIGWRLAFDHWGQGLAREGAQAALDYAWGSLRLSEVISMTVPRNVRSARVMEAIGMKRDPADDFDHPRLPAGHVLRRHMLYRLRSP